MRAALCSHPAPPTIPPVTPLNTRYYRNTHNIILQPPPFDASPAVVPDMTDKAPVDFFRLFFDERVIDLILTETTCYADRYLGREKEHLDTHPYARTHDWRRAPLARKEVEVFLALLIAMGICGFPTLR